MEILHTAVSDTKLHHCLEFFRNHGFPGIDAQMGRRQVKQSRKISNYGIRGDRITKTDVHLYMNSCTVQISIDSQSDAAIFNLVADILGPHACWIETDAIILHVSQTDGTDCPDKRFDVVFTETEEINIT